MSSKRAIILSCVIVTAATVLAGAAWFESGPDTAIYPRQDIPIFFPHNYHVRSPDPKTGVSGEGLDCDFCHENVGDSVKSSDRDIPGHDGCDSCHGDWIEEEATEKDCARCHRDLREKTKTSTSPRKMKIPAPNIKFPHVAHVSRDIACTECHSNVKNKTVATRDDYPTMDRCVSCHKEKGAPTKCTTCHLAGKDRRLVTVFKEGQLVPRRLHSFAIHDADFLRDHAVPGQRDKAYCENCHSEQYCLECHDGTGRDVRYHPGDWMGIHAIKARQDDPRCVSCHRDQSFCLNCHIQTSVASTSPVNSFIPDGNDRALGQAPHPMSGDGWLSPGSRNFHGFHAQRNIRACASCHQEQYCIACHTVGGSGGNPHGPNPERLRGSHSRNTNARMCLKCHNPLDQNWQ